MSGYGGTSSDADLLVQVLPPAETDDDELTELALLLRDDLLDLEVSAVEPVTEGPAPGGSKGAVATVAGWLAVRLGPEALRMVVSRIVAWASRSNASVEVSLGGDVLKVTGVSRAQQDRLIEDWISRHSG